MNQNFCFSPVVGNPFAFTVSMILVIIRMEVPSEKRMELSQTIASLIGSIRTEKGCKHCDFFQSIEDENELCLLEEWDSQENLKSYLKSGGFRVLRGAMNLLKEPYEMTFNTFSKSAGMGEI
jgi:quinol monooxygenase YgiN